MTHSSSSSEPSPFTSKRSKVALRSPNLRGSIPSSAATDAARPRNCGAPSLPRSAPAYSW